MTQRKVQTKVCYILSYYSPNYIRTITLINALRSIDLVKLYEARNSSKGVFRYFETIFKLLHNRIHHNPDIYILGFRGHEIFPFVKLITLGKPLIFDEFMSPYDSLINERRPLKKGNLIAKLIYKFEKLMLQTSKLIITDTPEHQDFLSKLFNVEKEKIQPIPVGADENIFKPMPSSIQDKKEFNVFFYSTFQPLHGVEIIVKAFDKLKDLPIKLTLVGKGKNDSTILDSIKQHELNNILYMPWIDFEKLPQVIADSDVLLGGPFGGTPQAQRVITGKTSQFLAMAKPTIIGRVEKSTDIFMDQVNCLLVEQQNPEALAEKIKWAYDNKDKLKNIGEKGREIYEKYLSQKVINQKINSILEQIIK